MEDISENQQKPDCLPFQACDMAIQPKVLIHAAGVALGSSVVKPMSAIADGPTFDTVCLKVDALPRPHLGQKDVRHGGPYSLRHQVFLTGHKAAAGLIR